MQSRIQRLKSVAEAHKNWLKMGAPTRPAEKIAEIYDNICTLCEHFIKEKSVCGVCGCYLKREGIMMNKIAMSTTRCPLEEPKWVEEPGFEQIKDTSKSLEIGQEIMLSGANKIVGDCGCGENK